MSRGCDSVDMFKEKAARHLAGFNLRQTVMRGMSTANMEVKPIRTGGDP